MVLNCPSHSDFIITEIKAGKTPTYVMGALKTTVARDAALSVCSTIFT